MSEETMENQQGTAKRRSGLSFFRLVGVVVIAAVIVAAGYFLMNQGGKAVAVVNGQKIMRSEYDERYAQLVASIASQGQSATTTEMQGTIKKQTLDNLITETLLLQSAGKEGLKANDEEINAQFSQNKSQFPDETAFEKALTAQGLTDNTFKEFLTRDNIIRQYLTAHIDVSKATATKEEVKTFYDQAAANDKTIPSLSEISDQIKNQIVQQKQQQLISNFIQQLRASSTVETLI